MRRRPTIMIISVVDNPSFSGGSSDITLPTVSYSIYLKEWLPVVFVVVSAASSALVTAESSVVVAS